MPTDDRPWWEKEGIQIKYDPQKLQIRSDAPNVAKAELENAFWQPYFDESQEAIKYGIDRGWIYEKKTSDVANAFASKLINSVTLGFVKPSPRGATPEQAQVEQQRLEEVAPKASTLGAVAGTALAMEAGAGVLGMVGKLPGIARLASKIPEAVGRTTRFGLSSGAYGAGSEAVRGGSLEDIEKAFYEDAKTGIIWGVGAELLIGGGAGAKQWADKWTPKIFSSLRGNLSETSVRTYVNRAKEVKDVIGQGLPNAAKNMTGQINDKIKAYVTKKNAVADLITMKMKTKIPTEQVVRTIDDEIKRLDTLVKAGDENATKYITDLIDYKNTWLSDVRELPSGGTVGRKMLETDGKTFQSRKVVAQDKASKMYEHKDIGQAPQLSKSYSKIAARIREIQSAAAYTVEGGQKLAKANADISKLARLQELLDIDSVYGYMRPGIKPSGLVQKARRLETSGAKAIEEYSLLKEMDALVGTNIIEKSNVLNAAIELSNPNVISALFTGRSVAGGMLGAAVSSLTGGDWTTGALIGGALGSPAISKSLITFGKNTGRGLEAIGKYAPTAIRKGTTIKVSDILSEREKESQNKLRTNEDTTY